MVRQIKEIVSECQKAGLKVVATVSDQGPTNVAAINYLTKYNRVEENQNTRLKLYQVNDQILVHIYDPPHLLKGIRNNFLKHKLRWKKNGETITGQWEDIIKTYELDNEIGELRSMPRLNETHVYPKKIRKMKVSLAAQVLSYSLASIMSLFERKGIFYFFNFVYLLHYNT